jgi:hypothetical protein
MQLEFDKEKEKTTDLVEKLWQETDMGVPASLESFLYLFQEREKKEFDQLLFEARIELDNKRKIGAEANLRIPEENPSLSDFLKELSVSERVKFQLDKLRTAMSLSFQGVKNPLKSVEIFVENDFIENQSFGKISLQRIQKGDAYDKGNFTEFLEKSLKSVYYPEQAKKLQALGSLSLLNSNLQSLGVKASYPLAVVGDGEQHSDYYNNMFSISRLSEDQFVMVRDMLNRYPFLLGQTSLQLSNLGRIAQYVVENEDVKNDRSLIASLEALKQMDDLVLSQKNNTYSYRQEGTIHPLVANPDLEKIKVSGHFINDQLIIFRHIAMTHPLIFADYDTYIFSCFEKLGEEKIKGIANLLRSGVILDYDTSHAIAKDKETRKIEQIILKASETAVSAMDSEEGFSHLQFLSAVDNTRNGKQAESSARALFSTSELQRAKRILDETEENNRIFTALQHVGDIMGYDASKKAELFKNCLHYNSQSSLDISVDQLCNTFLTKDAVSTIDDDKYKYEFIRATFDDPDIKPYDLKQALVQFLMVHDGDFDQLVNNGHYTNDFFDRIVLYINDSAKVSGNRHNVLARLAEYFSPENSPPVLKGWVEMMSSSTHKSAIFNHLAENGALFSEEMKNICKKFSSPNIIFVYYMLDHDVDPRYIGELINDELLEDLDDNQKLFWNEIKSESDSLFDEARFIFAERNNFSQLYHDGRRTPEFFRRYLHKMHREGKGTSIPRGLHPLNDYGIHEDLNAPPNFNKKQALFWSFFLELPYENRQLFVSLNDEMMDHLDEEGYITDETMIFLASHQLLDLQVVAINRDRLHGEEFKNFSFWKKWTELSKLGKRYVNKKLVETNEFDGHFLEDAEAYAGLILTIDKSPSLELKAIKEQLAMLLLQVVSPEKRLKEIVEVFEYNNLPSVIKRWKVADIIYFTPGDNGKTKFRTTVEQSVIPDEYSDRHVVVGPTIRSASDSQAKAIMYRDLLRSSISSGDLSLLSYMTVLQRHADLLLQAEHGYDDLSDEQNRLLISVLDKLDRIAGISGFSDDKNRSPKKRIEKLRRSMRIQESETLIHGFEKMYLRPLGFKSIFEAINFSIEVRRQAGMRNLESNRKDQAIQLHEGDLLKAFKPDAMYDILFTGFTSREFIGADSSSDWTPFDTDFGRVLAEDEGKAFFPTLQLSPARPSASYGSVVAVIKNRGQFNETEYTDSPDFASYDGRPEVFFSKVVGERHYGVRTSLAVTEVDGFILGDGVSDIDQQEIFFLVSNSGMFFRLFDTLGRDIFNEEDYQQNNINVNKIKELLSEDEFSPDEFLASLKDVPFLKSLYEFIFDGKNEVGGHTLDVMKRFEYQEAEKFSSNVIEANDFRIMLSAHDIGKRMAVEKHGDTTSQHKYTLKLLPFLFTSIGVDISKVPLLTVLVDQEILGDLLFKAKGIPDDEQITKAADEINKMAVSVHVDPVEFLELLKTFYICDGSSYAVDGEAQQAYGTVFTIKDDGVKKNVVFSTTSEETLGRIELLLRQKNK